MTDAERERAAVVAMLREKGDRYMRTGDLDAASLLDLAADWVERGDHLQPPPE